jgi:hypothetical protein
MKIQLTLFAILSFYVPHAFAYIDPGSGGALITAILGFFAAVAYSFKKFFYNIKSKFKSKKD